MNFSFINHLITISFIYSLVFSVNCLSSFDSSTKATCNEVQNLFINEGLNEKPNSGNLKICRKERSCCNRGIEIKLNVKSKTEFQQKFRQLITNNMENILIDWAQQFNAYYLNAIQLGHKEFDLMFQKLYGLRYKENYDLFKNFFDQLQIYHEKGEISLDQTLDEFFEKLFIRIFKMLNPNFHLSADFENCMNENYDSFEPFGEIPKNLLSDLKRQLGASRTFVQGLYAGSNVIKNLNQIDISNNCGYELMLINYCSLCSGYFNLKPCKENCELTYSKCMANYQDFENEWNKYLNTIIQFGKRLENTLNLENTLVSINYKISDVIMNFQENKVSISEKIFEKCSLKKLSKRSISEDDENMSNNFKEKRSKNQEITIAWKKLASEVKRKIKSLKSYWSKLPKAICKSSNLADKHCWNGTNSIDINEQMKLSIDLKINKNSNVYHLIDLRRNTLQMINNKLISSYNGNGLEKFDLFDTQASNINIKPLSTEFDDDYGTDDDEDDGDYEQRKDEEIEPQIIDESIDKLPEESNKDNLLKSEPIQDDESDNNKLKNDISNVFSRLDKPRNNSSKLNSYSINLSILVLIISQSILSAYNLL